MANTGFACVTFCEQTHHLSSTRARTAAGTHEWSTADATKMECFAISFLFCYSTFKEQNCCVNLQTRRRSKPENTGGNVAERRHRGVAFQRLPITDYMYVHTSPVNDQVCCTRAHAHAYSYCRHHFARAQPSAHINDRRQMRRR